jgi:hypothetical protein
MGLRIHGAKLIAPSVRSQVAIGLRDGSYRQSVLGLRTRSDYILCGIQRREQECMSIVRAGFMERFLHIDGINGRLRNSCLLLMTGIDTLGLCRSMPRGVLFGRVFSFQRFGRGGSLGCSAFVRRD